MSRRGERVVWLSGRFVAEERARVPATDASVTHGLGVFETLRVVRGEAPLVELHAARLRAACRALAFPEPARAAAWGGILHELAARNGIRSGVARITVGRSFALASCARLPRGLARERAEGVALETVRYRRGAAGLKGTSRLPLWLAERAASGEVLLAAEGGRLFESSRANLFVVTGRGIETAPAIQVLPGIARGLVLESARNLGVPISLRAPSLRRRHAWREAFLTNAVRGVRPLRSIEGVPVSLPGPDSLTRRLQKALDARMGL